MARHCEWLLSHYWTPQLILTFYPANFILVRTILNRRSWRGTQQIRRRSSTVIFSLSSLTCIPSTKVSSYPTLTIWEFWVWVRKRSHRTLTLHSGCQDYPLIFRALRRAPLRRRLDNLKDIDCLCVRCYYVCKVTESNKFGINLIILIYMGWKKHALDQGLGQYHNHSTESGYCLLTAYAKCPSISSRTLNLTDNNNISTRMHIAWGSLD